MSEPRFEGVLRELRATAPAAPDRLRARVRAIATPKERTRISFRLRPALAIGAATIVAVVLGGAGLNGLKSALDTPPASDSSARPSRARSSVLNASGAPTAKRTAKKIRGVTFQSSDKERSLSPLTPSARLQQYVVSMRLRVRDLSAATKSAVRTTRRLDGYVANAQYSTGSSIGESTLELRVPVHRVQQAIASFTDLGTILSQQIAVEDLQAGVDRIDRRLVAARKVVAELGGRTNLTFDERARLDAAKSTITRLSQNRARLVGEGTYAKISLSLTTKKGAAKQAAPPGRFDRFWSDAGDILGKEAIIVLYALVVAGPFAILAAFALLGERWRRRRADGRLLEETA